MATGHTNKVYLAFTFLLMAGFEGTQAQWRASSTQGRPCPLGFGYFYVQNKNEAREIRPV